jgi:hypothetical protein
LLGHSGEVDTSNPETLTIGQIAKRWRRPESTVRRDVVLGEFEGSLKGPNPLDPWTIPLEAVLAHPKYGPEPDAPEDTPTEQAGTDSTELLERLEHLQSERDRLEAENRDLDKALAVAQARLEEHEKAEETLELLRQMTPILAALAAQGQAPKMLEATSTPPRRRWFSRRQSDDDQG